MGVGGGGWAFLAFAKDAAVGANRPDAGVLGRVGVLARVTVLLGVRRDGVFARAGVVGRAFVTGGLRDDGSVCCGLDDG